MEASATIRPGAGSRELVPLMHAVAAGDRDALRTLYGRTSAKLFGICVHLLRSDSEAEEVLQDVFITVWQKAASFDDSRASPITWLAVLARNKAIDRLRLRRIPTESIDAAAEVPDSGASALELLERSEEGERLSHCLGELEERQQAIIRAAFLEGATYPELAEREKVPLGTMKSWIRRGLMRLRGCLEQ